LYRRRNTLAKKRILLSLRIVITTIKIKAETTTEITKTLAAIKYTDTLIATADLRDVTISIRKRIAAYRDI